MRGKISKAVLLILVLISGSLGYRCNEDPFLDEIPPVFVDETINLNNFEYSDLNQVGGFVYIQGGVRGIIIYRQSIDRYLAFERNCPYRPLDDCALVGVDKSTLFMIDSCCSSTFDFDGNPTGGPASIPLRQYTTFLDQNFLIITSEFN
jgi:hypothetical protein